MKSILLKVLILIDLILIVLILNVSSLVDIKKLTSKNHDQIASTKQPIAEQQLIKKTSEDSSNHSAKITLDKKRIEADLSKMKLKIYNNDSLEKEYNIVAKGSKKSGYYETPTGEFEISYKEELAFSKETKTWVPWVMRFKGDFYIHGIPRYLNGKEVKTPYSGGCIRLNNEDAQNLYKETEIGTRIKIYS